MKNSVPRHLSAAAKKWFKAIKDEFSITDPGGLLVLGAAAEAYDRMKAAQRIVEAEGMVTTDRFGQKKPHPCVVIERDSRAAMLAALRDLKLDLEPLHDGPGRPMGH